MSSAKLRKGKNKVRKRKIEEHKKKNKKKGKRMGLSFVKFGIFFALRENSSRQGYAIIIGQTKNNKTRGTEGT